MDLGRNIDQDSVQDHGQRSAAPPRAYKCNYQLHAAYIAFLALLDHHHVDFLAHFVFCILLWGGASPPVSVPCLEVRYKIQSVPKKQHDFLDLKVCQKINVSCM